MKWDWVKWPNPAKLLKTNGAKGGTRSRIVTGSGLQVLSWGIFRIFSRNDVIIFEMQDHRKLKVFGSADHLVVLIYQLTRPFPREERTGLVSQMRRAAVSVAANIAEGCGRNTKRELIRFLDIAFGSLREVEYYLDLCPRLGLCNAQQVIKAIQAQQKTARLLTGLIRSLRQK